MLDQFTLDEPKTKAFVKALSTLGVNEAKTLIVDSLENENLLRASRNVKRAKIVSSNGLNIYDLLYHEKLVVSRAAIEELNELLDPKRKGASGAEETKASGESEGNTAAGTTEEEAA